MTENAHPDRLAKINKEIDVAKYATSSPEVVKLAKEEGLASDITLSDSLGYEGKTEIPKANTDHTKRLERIMATQMASKPPQVERPGARGVGDLETNKKSGSDEKKESTDTTTSDSTKKPVRGEGRNNKDEDDD